MSIAEDEVGPIPPAELAGYVVGLEAGDGVVEAYRRQGALLGAAIAAELRDLWPGDGTTRALDFGCGSGRVLRQFARNVAPGRLVGCDIDRPCIDWVREHLPTVEAHVSGAQPPLPFADATFDVAWSMSVFSHLTDTWAAWLLELRRVVRPGGRLLVSVAGAHASRQLAGEGWEPDRIGMTVRGYGRPWRAGGPMVLHSEWWVRAHWGRAWNIIKYESGGLAGQDLVLLERPAGDAPSVRQLQAPEHGEPRELTAALHAIELANREHAELNRQHDAYAQAYIDEMARTEALRHEVAELRARLDAAGRRGIRGELRALARRAAPGRSRARRR